MSQIWFSFPPPQEIIHYLLSRNCLLKLIWIYEEIVIKVENSFGIWYYTKKDNWLFLVFFFFFLVVRMLFGWLAARSNIIRTSNEGSVFPRSLDSAREEPGTWAWMMVSRAFTSQTRGPRRLGYLISPDLICDVASQPPLGNPSSRLRRLVEACEYCVLCSHSWFSVLLNMAVWRTIILFEMTSVILAVGGWVCSCRDGWPCRVYLSFSKGHLSLYLSLSVSLALCSGSVQVSATDREHLVHHVNGYVTLTCTVCSRSWLNPC